MLEYLEYLELLWYNITIYYMLSNKITSADNQQESLKTVGWIVGFTDGEGCFSVSLIKSSTTKSGWQVFPEFVLTQGERSLPALKQVIKFFGCGKIFVNRRKDNHRENLYRYCVRSVKDLQEKIIPFFQQYPLQTAKSQDFRSFAKIVNMMSKQMHFSAEGMNIIASIIQTMNRKKPSRFLESSETKRQTPTLRRGKI